MVWKGSECAGCRVGESAGSGTSWVSIPDLLPHSVLWVSVPSLEVLAADRGVWRCMPELHGGGGENS